MAPPPEGRLYHGVFPGGATGPEYGEEDDLSLGEIQAYEKIVGQKVAWVYFSNNWYRSRAFPRQTATLIRETGAVPFVRLMLRPSPEQANPAAMKKNPSTLQAIVDGRFDDDLKAWGRAARDFGSPLIVEFGTEVNGQWFCWNGRWNGAGRTDGYGDPRKPDGPERFVAAFRHMVKIMRHEGADNISWVFHVNADDDPSAKWNRFENYYPGDDVVDWVGVSAYGAQTPKDKYEPQSLRDMLDAAYPRILAMAPQKPVMLLEFGCTRGHPKVRPEAWAGAALDDLLGARWPKLRGFSWWNERWQNDDDPAHDTTMRVQDIPALAEVFRSRLSTFGSRLQTRPSLITDEARGFN
ncbi:MAG: glycoside hydrolase family 26 protein [Chthoniobacterales bacterium]